MRRGRLHHLSATLSPPGNRSQAQDYSQGSEVKKLDLLITGVGGQGVILASDIIGDAAIAAGYDIKKTDALGMAQRGGSVTSNVRIAPQVQSPLIKMGEADMLLVFDRGGFGEDFFKSIYKKTLFVCWHKGKASPPRKVKWKKVYRYLESNIYGEKERETLEVKEDTIELDNRKNKFIFKNREIRRAIISAYKSNFPISITI